MGALRALKEGELLDLGVDEKACPPVPVKVRVGQSFGIADLRVVFSEDEKQSGLIAFKRDGSWWWVQPLEERPDA